MLRITSGVFRGRFIQTPPGKETRPTQARLRQALFNSLQVLLPDATVLDLFSGSGALGFESLSRGAKSVTFVESSRTAARVIEANAKLLQVEDRITLLETSVELIHKKNQKIQEFDLVLADPPYEEAWELKLLNDFPWAIYLKPGGHFCLEWGVKKSVLTELPTVQGSLLKVREKIYGDSALTTYVREEKNVTAS